MVGKIPQRMKKYLIEGKPTHIPTSWRDVQLSRFIDWLNFRPETGITQAERILLDLELRTGIDYETLAQLPVYVLEDMAAATSFYDDGESLQPFMVIPAEHANVSAIDLKQDTLEKLLLARQAYSQADANGQHRYTAAPRIVQVYTGLDITDWTVAEAIGLCAFFLTSYESSQSVTES